MNRIVVATFPHRAPAEPLRTRLVAAGVQAEIHDEVHLEKLWFVRKAACGARVEVPVTQSNRAQALILEWDVSEAVLRDVIRCPECKSLRVDYPQFTRKSFLPN